MGNGVQWVSSIKLADEPNFLWIFKQNDKIIRLQEQFGILD